MSSDKKPARPPSALVTSPANALTGQAAGKLYRAPGATAPMSASTIAPDGGSQPHDNMQPYLALTFIIALQGVFPSRG